MGGRQRLLAVVTVAGVCASALTACGFARGKSAEDTTAIRQKVSAVRLDSGNGSVVLRGSPGRTTVSVHRTLDYRGTRPKKPRGLVRGGVLVLEGCGSHCTVRYTVDLPAGLPVTGGTSNGSISLSRVGAVRVTSGNGAISLNGVAGSLDARTGNGEITGRALRGTRAEAHTTNGSIALTASTPQDIRARTANGAIEVTVPSGAYRVRTSARNGHRTVQVPDNPKGTHELDLTTSNGSISVRPS